LLTQLTGTKQKENTKHVFKKEEEEEEEEEEEKGI